MNLISCANSEVCYCWGQGFVFKCNPCHALVSWFDSFLPSCNVKGKNHTEEAVTIYPWTSKSEGGFTGLDLVLPVASAGSWSRELMGSATERLGPGDEEGVTNLPPVLSATLGRGTRCSQLLTIYIL